MALYLDGEKIYNSLVINGKNGNNITYPVESPSQDNYFYNENDINNIALAINKNVKVSEMAAAIAQIKENAGLHATNYPVYSDTYTEVT